MDRSVKESFSNHMLQEAAQRYDLSVDSISLIGGFQNFIYEYQRSGKDYIMRFTPQSHRTIDVVQAELEWIEYLVNNGVAVCRPVASATGHYLEVIRDSESTFIVTAFEKANGRKLGYPECLTDTRLFEECGRVTALMHTLAKDFNPQSHRHDWTENYYVKNLSTYIPASQEKVHLSCRQLTDEIDALPKDRDSYGLIHGDINVGNFHVHDDGVILFDFDECQYSWFVEDIAIQLYYLVYVFGDDSIDERMSQAHLFMEHFLKGYRSVRNIDEYWLRQIPLFLRLREIIVYVGMYRSWDLDNLNDWGRDFIAQSKVRIENGMSVVNSAFFEHWRV